jgi:hypothetical protein
MSNGSITIQVELRTSAPRPAGIVRLLNQGDTEIRVWQTGNSWGDGVLSFEVLQDTQGWHYVLVPQVYTRNVPSSLAVPAGGSHGFPFDLGDGSWQGDAPAGFVITPAAQLLTVYDVPESPEAVTQNVWTGHLQSEPVELNEVTPNPAG